MGTFTEMEDEEENDSRKSWKEQLWPDGIVMILAVLIIIIGYNRLGNFPMDRAAFLGFGILMLLMIARLTSAWIKHRSRKVIWERGYSTFTGTIFDEGNYGIIRLGGNDFLVPLEGRDGIIIFPKTAVNRIGKSTALTVSTIRARFEELPRTIQRRILQDNLRPPFLLGMASEVQLLDTIETTHEISGTKSPKITYLIEEALEKNRLVTLLSDIISGRHGAMEKAAAELSRISTTVTRTKFTDTIKESAFEKR